jgi:hypothetical protein
LVELGYSLSTEEHAAADLVRFAARDTLRVGTGVTCPTRRYHPAIVAQAAATVATMMPGRFYLGVGTGEALNERVVDPAWPAHPRRAEMHPPAGHAVGCGAPCRRRRTARDAGAAAVCVPASCDRGDPGGRRGGPT